MSYTYKYADVPKIKVGAKDNLKEDPLLKKLTRHCLNQDKPSVIKKVKL